jgi:hypothetical protein
MKDLPRITVRQLIALLSTQPQDVLVSVEGCDCTGDAAGVEFHDYKNTGPEVLIYRTDAQTSIDMARRRLGEDS